MMTYPPLRSVEEKRPRDEGISEEYQLAPAAGVPTLSNWQGFNAPAKPGSQRLVARKPRPVDDHPGPSWITMALLTIAAIVLMIYSIRDRYLLGMIGVPLLYLFGLHGIWRGGFRKLLMLPVIVVAGWWALKAPAAYGPPIQQFLRSADAGLVNLLVAACSIPILIMGMGLIQYLRRRFIMRRNLLCRFDRFIGALVGLAEGGVVMMVICYLVIFIAPRLRETLRQERIPKNSLQIDIVQGIIKISDEAKIGRIGEFLALYNPLEKYPPLREQLDHWADTNLAFLSSPTAGSPGPGADPNQPPITIQGIEERNRQRMEQYEQLKRELPSQRNRQP